MSNDLKYRLEQHKMWLLDVEKGKRFTVKENEDLSYANLSYANLSYADLRSANLSYADLRSANLSSANLSYANLSYADLRYANLRYADLSYANLSYADLSYADLSYADLRYANLREIKKDFFDRLLLAKNEAKGLYDYLKKGLVDGSSYESDCACFVGTVAKIAKQKYSELSCGLKPQASSPTEKWFLIIRKGDTPENNFASKIVCEWVEEFCKDHQIELPKYKIVSSDECPSIFE